jgi:DNA-binding transcriptional LysR family regulator
MKQAYPQIDIRFTVGDSGVLYRKVLDGELDAAIITQPPLALSKSRDWQTLREEPLIVLTRAPARARKAHAILESSRSFDITATYGRHASWTPICARPEYAHACSTGSRRSPPWWIEAWAFRSFPIGSHHGR